MSLKTEWIGNFNPFDFISCPACGSKEFISMSHASVWCDHCNTKFTVRHTAGDPGCVVDADTTDAYGPTFECGKCQFTKGSLDAQVECPTCKISMIRKEGYSSSLMERPPRLWYMILKSGDYCSGWLRSMSGEAYDINKMYEHPSCRDKNLEGQWFEFQEGIRRKP